MSCTVLRCSAHRRPQRPCCRLRHVIERGSSPFHAEPPLRAAGAGVVPLDGSARCAVFTAALGIPGRRCCSCAEPRSASKVPPGRRRRRFAQACARIALFQRNLQANAAASDLDAVGRATAVCMRATLHAICVGASWSNLDRIMKMRRGTKPLAQHMRHEAESA